MRTETEIDNDMFDRAEQAWCDKHVKRGTGVLPGMEPQYVEVHSTSTLPGYGLMRKLAIQLNCPLQALNAERDSDGVWHVWRNTKVTGQFEDVPMLPLSSAS